jgi:pyruvate dehydrogenase E2 component (dihydrolipoamide acetyltransferase)
MPALSPTMTQGNLVKWHVKEGQEVVAGTVLADIETDKATLAFENQEDGFVAKLLVPENTKDINIGTPVLVLVEDKVSITAFASFNAGGISKADQPADAPQFPSSKSSTTDSPHNLAPILDQTTANHRIGPAARMLLQESGLTMQQISPTGPRGIITKGDVLAAMESGMKPGKAAEQSQKANIAPETSATFPATHAVAAPTSAATISTSGADKFTDFPNTQIRKVIATRLLESKVTIPSLYLSMDAGLDEVMHLRKMLADQGIKVSWQGRKLNWIE